MSGYQTTATRNSLIEAFGSFIEQAQRSKLNNLPGKIVSYDIKTQTAFIQPLVKQKFGDKTLRAPELQAVPHIFPRGGGLTSYIPMKVGDKVMLQSAGRSLDNYLTGDKDLSASTGRHSDMSDMVATPGLNTESEALSGLQDDRMHQGTEDGKSGFQMDKEGKGDVKLKGDTSILKLLTETNNLLKELNNNTKSLTSLLGGLSPQALSISSIAQIVQLVTTFANFATKTTALNDKIESVRLE